MSISESIESGMKDSIAYLSQALRCESKEANTHNVVLVSGWDEDTITREAIGKYLVGLRVCAIDAALRIKSQLEDSVEDHVEVRESVYSLVGKSNDDLSEEQKIHDRNPWMAEAIWHLCLVIATRMKSIYPLGLIIAVNYPHVSSKDHGLDISALYETDDSFGLSIVESKAYEQNPNNAINESVVFFS